MLHKSHLLLTVELLGIHQEQKRNLKLNKNDLCDDIEMQMKCL